LFARSKIETLAPRSIIEVLVPNYSPCGQYF
jgi:hypothetical protein